MILDLTENVRARIDWRVILRFADWQSDDGGHDERDVEEDAGGLDLGHDSSEEDGDEAVCEDCGYVRPVDDCRVADQLPSRAMEIMDRSMLAKPSGGCC